MESIIFFFKLQIDMKHTGQMTGTFHSDFVILETFRRMMLEILFI